MATAAYHPAQAGQFRRRARDPTAAARTPHCQHTVHLGQRFVFGG